MADACVAGSEGDRAISLFKIRSISDKEYPIDSNQRLSQRRAWVFEVSDMDVDLVAEEGFGSLRAANENGRARPRVDEALSYPRADVARCSEDEVFHLSALQPRITSSAIRFWPARVRCNPSSMRVETSEE